MMHWIFWFSLVALAYTYLGYPCMLGLLARRRQSPIRRDRLSLPVVSVIIAANNEEERISDRIKNCLSLDYPRHCLEVIIISDGSTDSTNEILRQYEDGVIRPVVLPQRVGKAIALNRGVETAKGEILVFADARQSFAPDAIRELVANFADPQIGAVSGELVLSGPDCPPSGYTAGLYWHYEKWIRKAESRVDSVVGATGAIYAIRKKLFVPLPAGTILDDVMIPMRIVMAGHRVVFEKRAVAYDLPASSIEQEFQRKVRTLTGNFQILQFMPELLSPFRNRLFVQYFSHKVTRILAPYWLLSLFVSSLVLGTGVYGVALWAQVAGYTLALTGWLLRRTAFRVPLASIALTFVMMHYAAFLGLVYFFKARQRPVDVWVRN
ncbi:MAG TPA: glycosyltransferase family 2 protein [Nitrospiraceae bacterium]|nr:glycosyltransferase family 2 protein [Nitrospiraceae bacterium]